MSKKRATATATAELQPYDVQPGLAGELGSEVALQDFEASLNRGRPAGSKNRQVDQVDAPPPTACPKCQSTKRTAYFNPRTVEASGIDQKTGQVYTSVTFRRTRCCDCGQFRDDRFLQSEPMRSGKK